LEERENGRMQGDDWYGYVYPKNIEIMQNSKILVPDIADRAAFAIDDTGEFAFTSGYGITLRDSTQESAYYLLGVLNSSLLDLFLKAISTPLRGGFFRYFTQFIRELPIRRLDLNQQHDRAYH